MNADYFNQISQKHFPEFLGIKILEVEAQKVAAEMPIHPQLFAPNGFLHAGSIVSLADTIAGYACIANLPKGAKSFTTIELKCNFLGAAREGHLICESNLVHGGKTTQVWDVLVRHKERDKNVASFRCTQLILY